MKSKAAILWLAILFLFSGAMLLWLLFQSDSFQQITKPTTKEPGSPSTSEEKALDSSERLTEFTLTERSGKKFSSTELLGDVWVGSFFFASCPQTCVQKNLKIQELDKQYGPLGVRQVSITCNPDQDTPYALREYAKRFNADPYRWLFLTGNMDYIKRVGMDYFHQRVERAAHMEYLVVFDRQGTMRGQFDWSKPDKLAELKDMLTQLLAESAIPEVDESEKIHPSIEQAPSVELPEEKS